MGGGFPVPSCHVLGTVSGCLSWVGGSQQVPGGHRSCGVGWLPAQGVMG